MQSRDEPSNAINPAFSTRRLAELRLCSSIGEPFRSNVSQEFLKFREAVLEARSRKLGGAANRRSSGDLAGVAKWSPRLIMASGQDLSA
jgi:hypothetical protein